MWSLSCNGFHQITFLILSLERSVLANLKLIRVDILASIYYFATIYLPTTIHLSDGQQAAIFLQYPMRLGLLQKSAILSSNKCTGNARYHVNILYKVCYIIYPISNHEALPKVCSDEKNLNLQILVVSKFY